MIAEGLMENVLEEGPWPAPVVVSSPGWQQVWSALWVKPAVWFWAHPELQR